MNQCSGCGENFNSVTMFDKHRVGKHEYTFAEGQAISSMIIDGRRCLDTDEMDQKGWSRNIHGKWSDPAEAERVRSRFRGKGSGPGDDEGGE